MKHYKHILIVLICTVLAGCFSNKYIHRNQYLLDLPKVAAVNKKHSCAVFVELMGSVAPFDQVDFLYRVGEDRYLIDYYNSFLASPAEQLDSILKSYFKNRAKFNLNITNNSNSKYRLQPKLIEFYADYRDRNNPKAILAVRFILSDLAKNKTLVLLDKVFRSSIPLKAKTTKELLNAWNVGIRRLLQNSLNGLNKKIAC